MPTLFFASFLSFPVAASTLVAVLMLLAGSLGLAAPAATSDAPPSAEPLLSGWSAEGHAPVAFANLTAPGPGFVVLRVDLAPELAHVQAFALDGTPLPEAEVRTYRIVPAPVPSPSAPRADDNGNRAPATPQPPPVAPPPAAHGIERPLGILRVLRTVWDALLAALRAGGLLLVLYHRILPARALDHPVRARLLDLVKERPGLHVAALAEALGAHRKTLAYHLRVLARSRMVRLEPEGRTVRAFPVGSPCAPAPDASGTRVRALELLRTPGGVARDDLAALLGVTPQAVSYHLRILHDEGKVRVRWMGRHRRYEAA